MEGEREMADHGPHVRSQRGRPGETEEQAQSPAALLTVDQVAERLGTPARFVRRLVAQRRISYCKIGRYVRIADRDVVAFIEAGVDDARK
jgi:excisionase family DNA binding protein